MNLYRLIKLIQERRPIQIPPELLDLYQKIFSAMTTREFLFFWHMGNPESARSRLLIKQGERQNSILLILEGIVDVMKESRVIAELGRGSFVAEMSFLTGEPAAADMKAKEGLKYISWDQDKLRSLNELNPEIYMKLQNIPGRDLAGKIKVASKKVKDSKGQ